MGAVGKRNRQHIVMRSLFGGLDRVIELMPAQQSDLIKDDGCCLHWQDAEVASARPVILPKIVRPTIRCAAVGEAEATPVRRRLLARTKTPSQSAEAYGTTSIKRASDCRKCIAAVKSN